MKKLLTFVFLLLGLAISSNVFLLNAKSEVIHDTLFCSLKGKCSCGGNLQYTSKAYTIKKKCNPCKGTGKVRSGVDKNGRTYYEKCTMCDGKGYWLDWQSGYKCQNCGKVYR